MPQGSLAASVFGAAGIDVVVEQRSPPVVRFAPRGFAAKRGGTIPDPLPRHKQQQPLAIAVIFGANVGQRREVNVSRWEMLGGDPGPLQIAVGYNIAPLTPRNGHHEFGIVIVDHQGKVEDRLSVNGLRVRRRRQGVIPLLCQRIRHSPQQHHQRQDQFAGDDCHCVSLALIVAVMVVGLLSPEGSGQLRAPPGSTYPSRPSASSRLWLPCCTLT